MCAGRSWPRGWTAGSEGLQGRECRVDDQIRGGVELTNQAAEDGRLAAAAFSGQQGDAVTVDGEAESIESILEGLVVQQGGRCEAACGNGARCNLRLLDDAHGRPFLRAASTWRLAQCGEVLRGMKAVAERGDGGLESRVGDRDCER